VNAYSTSGNPLRTLVELVSAAFTGVLGSATLITGHDVDIELARAADLERLRRFFEQLSDTSTYYRFFGTRPEIPDDELRGVLTQRLPDHVTLLASFDGSVIGLGEYVAGELPDEVEVAFTVTDAHHREGVATLLLERLAVVALRCGMSRLTACTLPGNADMLLVFRTVGLPEQHHFDPRDGVIHVVLDLAGIDAMSKSAIARHPASSRLFA